MKLRDFTLTANELPPTNVYVLGYWEGWSQPFAIAHRDASGAWLDADVDECYEPTSWSHLPGGIALNRADFHGKFEIDLDAEV